MPRQSMQVVAAFVTLACVGGCGSGGSRTVPSGDLVSLLAPGVATEDGFVTSRFTVRTDGVLPPTGDLDEPGAATRARQFLSFDLSGVTPGSIVTSAVIRLDLFIVQGTPFTSLGNVTVDHVDFGVLDATDFDARALAENIGIAASSEVLGPRSIDVTDAVGLDVARGRNRSQFRLRFTPKESDGDFANDFASFAEADAATTGNGQAPVLALVLRLPR